MIKLTDMALAQSLTEDEQEEQREVILARRMQDGDHGVRLGDRLRQFIPDDQHFSLNVCQAVIRDVADGLQIEDWESVPAAAAPAQPAPGTEDTGDEAGDWAWRTWQTLGLEVLAHDLHTTCLRDGEAFLIVAPDTSTTPARRLSVSAHPRWTDSQVVGGDDYGVKMFYTNNDPSQPALYASKWWTQLDPASLKATRRRTVYFADRVEKYIMGSAGLWVQHIDPGDASWPLPWVDAQGKPLGIPVIHFRNEGDEPEARKIWPLQGVINKTLLDTLMAGDATAYRIYVARGGWAPTTDGKQLKEDLSNRLVIHPGMTLVTGRKVDEGQLDTIEAAPVTPLMDIVDKAVAYASMVSGVNLSSFQLTRQLAGAETVKQQREPLTRRIERDQIRFGFAWAQALDMARRITNTFLGGKAPEDAVFQPIWTPARPVDPSQKYADAEGLKKIGVPMEILWAKAGMTSEEIAQAKATPEYQAVISAQQMALGRGAG